MYKKIILRQAKLLKEPMPYLPRGSKFIRSVPMSEFIPMSQFNRETDVLRLNVNGSSYISSSYIIRDGKWYHTNYINITEETIGAYLNDLQEDS